MIADADILILRERRRRATTASLDATRYDPAAYIRRHFGWTPWAGSATQPGQQEVLDAYVLALRQQHERDAFEAGEVTEADLRYWQPGATIQNRIRIEAGHTVGKTKLLAGLVNHFFDHFRPSVGYGFAPSWEQIHDLLFKEIKADRRGKGLPGRILDLALDNGDDHFFKGRATNNNAGQGTERAQGQHGKYLLFVLDEAEGVADFVWDAIDSMASGGIAIVLMAANPRTRTSRFHRAAALANVQSFRISCLWHPNVVAGRELVPGAVRRQYVLDMVDQHCQVADRHDPDQHTFTLPFAVTVRGQPHTAGTILIPDSELLFRVLGIAPANIADNTFVPVGRYDAARLRRPSGAQPRTARIGVDVARYGSDVGTAYVSHGGRVWRFGRFPQLDSVEYSQAIRTEVLRLAARGVTSIHIRVDGGGGFGSGVIDQLKRDVELRRTVADYQVFEVHFNGTPTDPTAYADLATEMYAHAAEALQAVALDQPPPALESDLTERAYRWGILKGIAVKELVSKELFHKAHGRSPDDGDGFALCVAPDHLFRRSGPARQSNYMDG